ncbi:MutS-related protein [Rhodanobacter ginsenosidimutans]|uniref:DNA mismatch repair proteins mutS family domain-containing protein n=1 Tax=Rhodanobacter ginsenosidimutans TaxID=490571 RepID=A0ABW0JY17_9GAMM
MWKLKTFSTGWDSVLRRLSPRKTLLAELRAQWGKPGTVMAWRASAYFDLVRNKGTDVSVDDRTWLDLEFPKIFSRLDTTATPLGSQYLFASLRTYVDDPQELAARYTCADMLQKNAALRENILLALAALSDDGLADIAEFVFGDPPRTVEYPKLLAFWSALSLLLVLGAVASLWSVWLALAAIAINVGVMARLFWNVQRDATALKRCVAMLPVADVIAAIPVDDTPFKAMHLLREQKPLRRKMQKKLRWLALLQKEPIQFISTWINVVFLAELVAYTLALRHFAQMRTVLQSTYALLGSIDASIAVASCLERCPDRCRPEFASTRLIDIQAGYHPLLAIPVCNSLRLDDRSALVTGSNMAGKTTLIKMIGINIILGRTLGFCLAARAVIPQSSVMASIRSEHSVESGKSHYFGEIERLQTFIENADRGDCRVFIIDELFSGTNTVERIAIARAVLEQLGADAQVLVTTHDVELQQHLSDHYDLYHFQENPDIEGFFDYQLMPGPATQRNAIRLLDRIGFPAKVVARAMKLTGA